MKSHQHLEGNASGATGAIVWRTLGRLAVAAAIATPVLAMAQSGSSGDITSTTCGFLTSVQTLLNVISIVVVTIAIIFSGYQIAFAHKRIGDVAPVFIGAILIGAASQIANMFLKNSSQGGCTTSSIAPDALTQLASIAHSLAGYLA